LSESIFAFFTSLLLCSLTRYSGPPRCSSTLLFIFFLSGSRHALLIFRSGHITYVFLFYIHPGLAFFRAMRRALIIHSLHKSNNNCTIHISFLCMQNNERGASFLLQGPTLRFRCVILWILCMLDVTIQTDGQWKTLRWRLDVVFLVKHDIRVCCSILHTDVCPCS